MKNRFIPLITMLCMTGFIAVPAIAAESSNNNPQYKKISTKTQKLEAQLNNLEQEVRELKSQLKTQPQAPATYRLSSKRTKYVAPDRDSSGNPPHVKPFQYPTPAPTAAPEVKMIHQEATYLPFDLDVPGQAFVSTGPYVGVPIQYAGSDLIINTPSVNTDLQLLGIRKHIIEQLTALGGENFKEPYHSHLLLSGIVEGQTNYLNHSGPNNGGSPSTDIDLTNVTLDFTFLGPSDWILGFAELTYDNSTPAGSVFLSPSQYRVSNSRILVNKAFITIGDLLKSPFYGTMGQFYVPFGAYSSFMVSSTLTQSLTRTKARAIEVGVQQQGKNAFYGSTYIFRGDTHATSISRINNGGINLGYKYDISSFSGNVGAGVIANIADSGGMQVGNNFQAFEQIVHRVPGYNLRGNLAFGEHVDVIIEYVGASTRFNPTDMAFDNHGAKPWAVDGEGIYSFTAFDKPSSIGIGYQKSTQALALGLPLTRLSLVLNTSWWRNTLQSIEFRRDREYAASHTAGNAGNVPAPQETGQTDKAITAQFDYYF